MFDIGWQELFIVAVFAIIVIGPKDLPKAIRSISKMIRKARSMARDLQDSMDDVIREADLEDIRNTVQGDGLDMAKSIGDAAGLEMDDLDLDTDLRKEMMEAEEDLKAFTNPDKDKIEKAPAKKSTPKKTTAKKASAKKSTAKKTAPKKSPAKKAPAKKTAAKAKAKG